MAMAIAQWRKFCMYMSMKAQSFGRLQACHLCCHPADGRASAMPC